jgi:hypothetical protein
MRREDPLAVGANVIDSRCSGTAVRPEQSHYVAVLAPADPVARLSLIRTIPAARIGESMALSL